MKKISVIAILLAFILIFSGCAKQDMRSKISNTLGIDIPSAATATKIDNHGGFHGDGTSLYIFNFEDDSIEQEIAKNELWHEFPLCDEMTKLLYGLTDTSGSYGPYITFDDFGTPAVPSVENGYWFFLDRQAEGDAKYDPTFVFERHSFNLTLAIYDADSDTLYYIEFDT